MKKQRSNHNRIVVGVKLAKSDSAVVEKSALLANMLGSSLHLVHVLPSASTLYSKDHLPEDQVTRKVENEIPILPRFGYYRRKRLSVEEVFVDHDREIDEAMTVLDSYASSLRKELLEVTTEVLLGSFPMRLIKKLSDGEHIIFVMGTSEPNFWSNFKSRSHIKKICRDSPRPVVLVTDGVPKTENERGRTMRLLIADDLQDKNLVVETTIDFCRHARRPVEVLHVTVEDFTDFSFSFKTQPKFSTSPNPKEVKHKLMARGKGLREYLSLHGGQYRSKVLYGIASVRLKQIQESFHPDFSIFGQHHKFYWNPPRFGRFPIGELVRGGSCIVVPDGIVSFKVHDVS